MELDEEASFNVQSEQTEASTSEQGKPVPDVTLSKKAQKRLARKAQKDALKPARRAAEKQRRRERAHYLSQANTAGTLSPSEREAWDRMKAAKQKRAAAKRGGLATAKIWKGGVVVDLGFDELMTDQEITSMVSQLGHLYSTNRLAQRPFASLLHTSFGPTISPRLWEKMKKANWEKWSRTFWWSSSIGDLAKQITNATDATSPNESLAAKEGDVGSHQAGSRETSTKKVGEEEADGEERSSSASMGLEKHLSDGILPPEITSSHKLVYLSADANEELETLAENEVYVIGGIVDRNRYKFLCQRKAEDLGIRTARLPIGKFIENLPTRKVLTVNQVFEILSRYLELKDWKEAFEAVIPLRKFHVKGKTAKCKEQQEVSGEGEEKGEEEEGREGDEEEEEEEEEEDEEDMGEGNESEVEVEEDGDDDQDLDEKEDENEHGRLVEDLVDEEAVMNG